MIVGETHKRKEKRKKSNGRYDTLEASTGWRATGRREDEG
jgi:hypothetical protein